jgi:hypothetical protein
MVSRTNAKITRVSYLFMVCMISALICLSCKKWEHTFTMHLGLPVFLLELISYAPFMRVPQKLALKFQR